MRSDNIITSTIVFILSIAVLLCAGGASIQAQQSDVTKFNQGYETALAKAQQDCKALWSDHAFDPIRDRIPLGEEKPSFSMLTNTERLRPKDRPLADLAKKTLERCRTAYAPVYAMLPPQVNGMIKGIERQQDALIAELYVGKITFGQFNVSMDRITGEFLRALSGIPQTVQPATSPADLPKSAVTTAQPIPSREMDVKPIPTHTTRIALVIGNSHYQNLPKLTNSTADARAIADLLKQIGYVTRLVLDASEQDVRREVRKFAGESVKADIALVFYAGHGAQVHGENYLLPVDIEIARTEADIELTGFKVDDLVNSIRSTAKVIFLDACRDNPVLFKNLVQGRGAHSVGLAPAVASNLEQVKQGGGVFIAYATDSGSVALDGQGEHSPFTQALLRNLRSPISIDDMFSLVTKEVRLVTKNMQRPYKYASLENIICLTGNCQGVASYPSNDAVQEAKRSESEELQIALQTHSTQALESYLQEHPDSAKRVEILNEISSLKRSEFNDWTLFEVANKRFPQFLKLNSVEVLGDKVAVKVRYLIDPSVPVVPGKQFPDNSIP